MSLAAKLAMCILVVTALEKIVATEREKGQRRVYVLPSELVDRIVAYQKEMGIQSEVEAARRLLDEALKSRDTWRAITQRVLDRLKETRDLREISAEVLISHPLVTAVNLDPSGVKFQLKSGESIDVDTKGSVIAMDASGEAIELKSGGGPEGEFSF
jgi:hypothetical protein